MGILGMYLLVINVITFIVYWVDKRKAKKEKPRLQEKTLLICAAIGGSLGGFLAIQILNHKRKKMKFNLGVPAMLFLHTAIVILVANYLH